MKTKRHMLWGVVGVLLIALAGNVLADIPPVPVDDDPIITVSTDAGGEIYSYSGAFEGTNTAETTYGTVELYELGGDPDPTVFANQLIYNTTAETQTYTINVSQPAYLASAPSQVYGSVVVSLQDTSIPADGATLGDNGTSIYKAYVDGNLVDTLLDNPYSLVTSPSSTTSSGLQEFGWDSYSFGVDDNIAITIDFTLSAGDTATVLSRFDVIPEPASMAMIGLVTGCGFFIRRRFVV